MYVCPKTCPQQVAMLVPPSLFGSKKHQEEGEG